MITIRPAAERGRTQIDWLDSYHSFSFGDYYDPDNMGFHSLRVINDDRIGPGGGFPTHPHRDMEIITWVLSGGLEHRDSLGTGSVIRAGDVQRMTAGTGIRHSEFNASDTEPVHLLQIWLLPEQRGLTPGYEEKRFPAADRRGQLKLIASRDGRDGSIRFHQDGDIYVTALAPGDRVKHQLAGGRGAWVQVATGSVRLNGRLLQAGDGAAIEDEGGIELVGEADGETLLFDLG